MHGGCADRATVAFLAATGQLQSLALAGCTAGDVTEAESIVLCLLGARRSEWALLSGWLRQLGDATKRAQGKHT